MQMEVSILKLAHRAGDEVSHRGGDQDFARPRGGRNARPDVNRDSGDVVTDDLDFARVQAAARLKPDRVEGFEDRLSAANSPRRPVEGSEESIPGGVDLASALLGEDGTHPGV